MLWFDGVLRSYGVFVDSRRSVPSCRPTETTSGAAATASESRASGPRRVGRVECARSAARVGSGGPSQPHAPIPAKRAGRPTSENRGIWSALRSSEAPSSGVVRAVALLSHRDTQRTASEPREGPRLRQQAIDLPRQVQQIERRNLRSSTGIINSWRLTQ